MKKSSYIFVFFLVLVTTTIAQNTYVMDVRSSDVMFYVEDNANNDLDLTSSYTIEFWIYLSANGARYQKLMKRVPDSESGEYWSINIPYNDTRQVKLHTHININGTIEDGYISSGDVVLDEWHFISVSYDATNSNCYLHVDGELKASKTNLPKFALPASDGALNILAPSTVNYLEGVVDEIRLSNIDRYSSANYSVSTTDLPLTDDANTVLLYHFDDGALPPTSSASNFSFTHVNGSTTGSDANDVISSNYVDYNSVGSGLPLPVELTSFKAKVSKNGVILNWETATEVNNYGFEIERASTSLSTINHQSRAGSNEWEVIGFVTGHGSSNSPQNYSFLDTETLNGNIQYRLKQIDTDGTFEYSDVVTVTSKTLAKYELYQNYPNPFNPSTVVSFTLPEMSHVKIAVYNVIGQEVAKLVDKEMEAGFHNITFDGSNLSTGLYIYRLETPNYSKTMKMILLR